MKTFFKYQGGKSREIKRMSKMFPNRIKRVVEPFAGSAAVAFSLEKPALISDINEDSINLLQVVKDPLMFKHLMEQVEFHIKQGPSEEEYYRQRKIMNDKDEKDKIKKAFSFLYVRQLCFSGMHRISINGFNVPYGWYKSFSTALNISHHDLLKNWEINLCSFEETLQYLQKDDFIFLDPPYYERNSEYAGGHDMGTSKDLHIKLYDILNQIKEKWLIVHVDCDLYRDLYKNYNIYSEAFNYSMNFKGRESEINKVNHLYIRNYNNDNPLF